MYLWPIEGRILRNSQELDHVVFIRQFFFYKTKEKFQGLFGCESHEHIIVDKCSPCWPLDLLVLLVHFITKYLEITIRLVLKLQLVVGTVTIQFLSRLFLILRGWYRTSRTFPYFKIFQSNAFTRCDVNFLFSLSSSCLFVLNTLQKLYNCVV